MPTFPKNIVCCYLYTISKYGYPPPAKDTLIHLEEMKALGFQSVELEGIREAHLMDIFQMRFAIQEKLRELSLEVPYFCAVLPGLSASDKSIREKNLQLFEKGCTIAKLFGAKGILDNAPLPPYQFSEDIPVVRHYHVDTLQKAFFPEDLVWREYWKDLVATYQQACDIAASFGLTYQMHPAQGVLAANADGFLYFAEALNRPNLRFNFDVANLFALKENLSLTLLRLIDYIDYIHVSDNGGEKVEHLAIGEGKISWTDFFRMLKRINFKGHLGIDIGGSESKVMNLEKAYQKAANYFSKY